MGSRTTSTAPPSPLRPGAHPLVPDPRRPPRDPDQDPARRLLAALIFALCGVFALSACGSSGDGGSEDSSDSASASGSSGDWPRTVEDDNGDEVTIDSQPENIVSTSVTLTGSLLAVDAPVKATGITQANSPLADDKGFFTQWGDVAEERGVKALSGITTKPEEVAAEDPDLIIVSKTGQDSAMEQLDQLKEIGAPVFVVDYADKDWQDVTEKLGEVTGHEQQAEDVVKKYEDKLAEVKDAIELPEQPTTDLNYNPSRDGSGSKANIWTDKSAQGRMLEELGFELTTVPDDAKSTSSQMGQRDDIVRGQRKPLQGHHRQDRGDLQRQRPEGPGLREGPARRGHGRREGGPRLRDGSGLLPAGLLLRGQRPGHHQEGLRQVAPGAHRGRAGSPRGSGPSCVRPDPRSTADPARPHTRPAPAPSGWCAARDPRVDWIRKLAERPPRTGART